MTEKQVAILEAALSLFAEVGYNATPTSKVAKLAGVSEGLIFRHFGNKEGLLNALLERGEEKVREIFVDIVMETDPREVIRKTLSMPFEVPETEFEFWRLQFKLKWEVDYDSYQTWEPVRMALKNAFEKLGTPEPAAQAELLIHVLDGVSAAILKGHLPEPEAYHKFLLKKFEP